MTTRFFDFVEGTSSKFWEIDIDKNVITTRYGKIGTQGQSTRKELSDIVSAQKSYDALIKEKIRKGYVEKLSTGTGSPSQLKGEAKKSSKGSKTAAKANENVSATSPSFLSNGLTFTYQMADFDVCEPVQFSIVESGDGLTVMTKSGSSNTELRFSTNALETASRFIIISQGGAMSSDFKDLPPVIEGELPPFLLSRRIFAELMKGPSKLKPEWGDVETEIEIVEEGVASIAGQARRAFHVSGSYIQFWVLDDAQWPVIIWRDEANDNHWRLLNNGGFVEMKTGASEQDEEDETPPAKTAFKQLVRNVKKASFVPKLDLTSNSKVLKVLQGRSSDKAIREALAKTIDNGSFEMTLALFALLANPDLRLAVSYKLRERANLSTFPAALKQSFENFESKVQNDDGEPYFTAAAWCFLRITRTHLNDSDFALAMRDAAKQVRNVELRQRCLLHLVQEHHDPVLEKEAIEFVAQRNQLKDIAYVSIAPAALIRNLAPSDARVELEALNQMQPEAQHQTIWSGLYVASRNGNRGWMRELIHWWQEAKGEAAKQLFEIFERDLNWENYFDLADLHEVRAMYELYLLSPSMYLCDAIEGAFRKVTNADCALELMRLHLTKQNDNARGFGSSTFSVIPLTLVPRPNDVCAELLKTVPVSPLEGNAWKDLRDALVDRKERVWEPVIELLTKRMDDESA